MNRIVLVFMRAILVAQESGSATVGIDELLTALDLDANAKEDPPIGLFEPVPSQDMPLTQGAVEAITLLGGYDAVRQDVSLKKLRAALLAVKHKQAP
jgi:hypothetical protein